jgi:hypothetical protein
VDPTSAPDELLEGKTQSAMFTSAKREEIRKRWMAQIAAKATAMREESKP